ncbi:DcaP family trimeric outer membrane transporter [Marinobacter subterrani]|uniref:Porin n=1 Tax=Marinobacter subterrani TaxID=1658765 RepID=A0A0J7JDX9_9GAMM|nr:DcaP family trimeric outer membrane transporter [Marinobacter subterrani]KMQ76337.1 hypothetical protein Msub_12548 [Marinobacter subterrani]
MQSNNKLRMAIRATAAVAVFGVAGQAGAVSFTAGDYEMAVYGYARFNASYDIDENVSTSTRSFDYGKINVGAAEDNEATGYFGADAVQSRIGVKATSPEGVMVNIEGDFRPGNLRLRHAYGSYNGVLAGQTWSNFTSFVGNTSTLDFDSLPGAAGYQSRTPQIRYTTGALSFSAEDPKNSIANAGAAAKNGMPALTARLEDSAGGLSYSAAVLAQQVGYDTGTADGSSFGFGTFVAAKMSLTDMITIQGALSYTDGANSYLYRSAADSAYIGTNGDVETISGYGGTIGTGINLGGGRSINVGYGMTEVDLDDAVAAGAYTDDPTQSIAALMANYKWTPVKNVMMGVEYKYATRETQSGDDGDASSVAFAAQYNF